MLYPFPLRDRQLEYYEWFDARMRQRLLDLVTDEVVAEHQAKPLGQHSDALDRLLNYFRRGGLANKVGILKDPGDRNSYRLVRFSGVRGAPAQVLDGPEYSDLNDAYHGAFLQRVGDLRASLDGDLQ